MLAKTVDAKVRPLATPSLEKSSGLGAARIYVSRDTLLSLTGGLKPGKLCTVTRLESAATKESAKDSVKDELKQELQREASLYILPEKNLSPNVVMMTRVFQEATGFQIGDLTRITLVGTTPDATEVVVKDVSNDYKTSAELERLEECEKVAKTAKYPPAWESLITSAFEQAKQLFPGMVVEAVQSRDNRRNFQVISVNSQTNSLANFNPSITDIKIDNSDSADVEADAQSAGDLVVTGVPGMSAQIKVLNDFLDCFTRDFYVKSEKKSCAFVIHGSRGTGKSYILERIAETRWGKVHWIKSSDKLSSIKETFRLAQSQQPSIILIDDLQHLINTDRTNHQNVIELLRDELHGLAALASSANALPRVVVVATCSDFFADIPDALRTPRLFNDHTPLPIPNSKSRLEILEFMELPIKPEDKESTLKDLAKMTHAFSPRDLEILAVKATSDLAVRSKAAGLNPSDAPHYLSRSDLVQARSKVRPTAMRDINLSPPTVYWQDVGGQDVLKRVLGRIVRYLENPERYLRPPPTSLLLYGPPGCSKTYSAQALATESGFNFFSVKAAELLNMYVGESERGIRALFQQASNASPSIIFFDEIDSIAGQRTGGSASRSTAAVNMVTTLLTELDGFETLSNVIVLAATNRPESIDPALMRPGRFDKVLYVGPPDVKTREAIFRIHLRDLPLAADVDIPELARLAEGHSGAEIKAVVNNTVDMIQERFDIDESDTQKLELTMADLTTVLERTPCNITKEMVDGYEKWSKKFGKGF